MRFFNIYGNDYSIIGLVFKVYYDIAVHTPKMVMIGYVGIIPSRFSVSLNEMDNPDFSVLAGMSASVRFPVGGPTTVLLVNKDAVVTSGNRHHVFIVNDDKAHLIPVKKGKAYGNQVAIQGEVTAGQRAVIEGNERLRPGQPVKILGK